jgi:diamine N-acetyltransferase
MVLHRNRKAPCRRLFHVNRLEGHAQMAIKILDPRYVGQGYGREAIGLLLEWAFHLQNLRRIYLDVLSSNERAIRAYQACGFVIEGRMREHAHHRGTYQDLVMMGILRSEWNAARES